MNRASWAAVRGVAAVLGLAALLGACTTPAPVVVGSKRPPIDPSQVKIYMSPPPVYEDVAMLNASSSSVLTVGGSQQMNKIIDELKKEAAALGANGVILEGFTDAQTGALGTGVGSQSYSGNSSMGLGVGGSFGIYKKTGHGRAIFLSPEAAAAAASQTAPAVPFPPAPPYPPPPTSAPPAPPAPPAAPAPPPPP